MFGKLLSDFLHSYGDQCLLSSWTIYGARAKGLVVCSVAINLILFYTRVRFHPFGSHPPHPRQPNACAWRERRDRTTGARLRPLDSSRARGRTLARGLPPRRGVRGSAAPCIKFIVFRPHGHIFVSRFGFGLQPLPLRNIPQHGALPAVLRPCAAPPFLRRHCHGRSGDVFAAVVAHRPRALRPPRGATFWSRKFFSHSIFCMAFAFKTWRAGAP